MPTGPDSTARYGGSDRGDGLLVDVLETRRRTVQLCAPLDAEDMVVQSMPDASPAKWHLAHTTWFFDRFVLRPLGAPPVSAAYDYLFNSYYDGVGERHPRSARGLLSRPPLADVMRYRATVDARLADLASACELEPVRSALELGRAHEEQHQELLLTDIKHLFFSNPLLPAYRHAPPRSATPATPLTWHEHAGSLVAVGHEGDGFAFDNERPRHQVHLAPFALASRVVTCGEYAEFIRDGGYETPSLWLAEGHDWIRKNARRAPLYWLAPREHPLAGLDRATDEAHVFTLGGLRALDPAEPVCHVTYYEADAYARWASARLPTETEWEALAARDGGAGACLEDGRLHPAPARGEGVTQMIGDVWEWTQSAYSAYPGFRPLEGAFGEYNGKFMINQWVLRGGSCVSPRGHVRATYRNFFPTTAAWQFSGIRLARDV